MITRRTRLVSRLNTIGFSYSFIGTQANLAVPESHILDLRLNDTSGIVLDLLLIRCGYMETEIV